MGNKIQREVSIICGNSSVSLREDVKGRYVTPNKFPVRGNITINVTTHRQKGSCCKSAPDSVTAQFPLEVIDGQEEYMLEWPTSKVYISQDHQTGEHSFHSYILMRK